MTLPDGTLPPAIELQSIPLHYYHTGAQQADDLFRRNHAYKYYGYPNFCKFMASDNDVFILRRFGELNSRVLLKMQFDISRLEDALQTLDRQCMDDPDDEERNFSFEWDEGSPKYGHARLGILSRLEPMLKAYNEYIVAYSDVRARESARNHQVVSVKNRFATVKNAVKSSEQQYIEKGIDLISICNKRTSPLVSFCERSRLLRWMFKKKHRKGHVDETSTQYWSLKSMEAFSDSLVIIGGLLMLFAPMWWLNWVRDDSKRLAIITSFVSMFAIGLRLVSDAARPFEVLAATAAYAAVLMVFVQKQN